MNDPNRDVDKQPALDSRDLPVRDNTDYAHIADRVRRYQNKRLPIGYEDQLFEELRDKERGCDDQ